MYRNKNNKKISEKEIIEIKVNTKKEIGRPLPQKKTGHSRE